MLFCWKYHGNALWCFILIKYYRIWKFFAWEKPVKYTEVFDKKVNSVYTEFPLILKLRTDRINNFALYATGGAKYGYDWASQIGVKESFDFDDIVKIKRSNFAWTVGGGIDFFLPYFKFGIDLKYDFGFNDVNVKNGTFFSNPIQRMETQSWRIAFTFEG